MSGMILNWNTDERYMRKFHPKSYRCWRLIQSINYGGEKLKKKEILKNWDYIKDQLDIDNRKALEFLVWGTKWKGEIGLRPDRANYLDWLVKTKTLHQHFT